MIFELSSTIFIILTLVYLQNIENIYIIVIISKNMKNLITK